MSLLVPGFGSPNAKLWLIGEAPGTQESLKGVPFVGGAGMVLDGILAKVGIERSKCYIDNVIQYQPKANDFSPYYLDKSRTKPTQELIEAHTKLCLAVKTYKPNLVVALGSEPLYALTGKHGIMDWRGSVLSCNGVKVIPTIHPAAVMRQYEFHPIAVMDFHKIKEESAFPEIRTAYQDDFKVSPSFETILFFLKEVLPKKEYLAFDIETNPEQKIILCIGFAWSDHEAICIPFCYGESAFWTLEEEFEIIKALRDLFHLSGIKFIAQNAQYDMTWVADVWGIKTTLWLDTMIAFHCCYPELKKSLAFLTSIYTKRPFYKNPEQTPLAFWTYNCLDCVVTFECAFKIVDELKDFGTYDFYMNHSNMLVSPLMEMQ